MLSFLAARGFFSKYILKSYKYIIPAPPEKVKLLSSYFLYAKDKTKGVSVNGA